MRIELSASEIFKIIASKSFSDSSGMDCRFYNMTEYGIKRYFDPKIANHTFNAQAEIAKTGYAPKCWNFVELEDGSYAYLTEIATMSYDVARKKTDINDRSAAQEFLDKWRLLLSRKLRTIFPSIECSDMHSGNWGFLRMRPVIIDVGHFNGEGVFENTRWNSDSDSEEF